MSTSPVEQVNNNLDLQQEFEPIEWGGNLARTEARFIGVGNGYLELSAKRLDGSEALFGEMTGGGYDGSRHSVKVSPEAELAAPGRALVRMAVDAVMELEELTEPKFERLSMRPPIGDWEPEDAPGQNLRLMLSGLSLQRSIYRRMEALKEAGGVAELNRIVTGDQHIAVGLQGKGSNWSIIKLMGFQEYSYANSSGANEEVGVRAVVRDRNGVVGLRPENARIERAFIKRI